MDALVLHGVGDLRLERVARPNVRPGWALVRVAAASVCGSDVPRIYDHGAHRHPLILGHEASGVVEEVAEPGPRKPGDRVTIKPLISCGQCDYCHIGSLGQCVAYDYLGSRRDGAFAEYVLAPTENLLPLPDAVGLVQAALTEPAAVALHALRQGGVQPGDAVAILGCGPIGMLVAQWAHVWGAGEVLLVDIDPRKLELATRLGLGHVYHARQGDAVPWAQMRTRGRGPDLVVEAAGVSATVEQAIRMVRPLGRVVILGNPSGDVFLPQSTVSLILRKQLVIVGSWNSDFVPLPVDEWHVVLGMVAAGRIDLQSMIGCRVPLREGPQAIARMRMGEECLTRMVLINDSVSGAEGE